LCYRDNTLTNLQLTWTSIGVTETILWRIINLRGQVFVLQRQYFDVIPEHRLPPYRGGSHNIKQYNWNLFTNNFRFLDIQYYYLPTMLITCCALCLYHIYTHYYICFIFKWTVNSHPGRHVWNALVRVEVGKNGVHDLVQIQHLDMVVDDVLV
jgi:hypothetical protein